MRLRALKDATLDRLLADVSRSFYLSLAILPPELRVEMSVAYLVARAADTIADTKSLPAERRLDLLLQLKSAALDPNEVVSAVGEIRNALSQTSGPPTSERVLLERLGDCLRKLHLFEEGARKKTQTVLTSLVVGMERDLNRFPEGAPLVTLQTLAELDEHCYYAAGCVGEYWTQMLASHVRGLDRLSRPDFVARGVRLGKALQMVNVIRDAPADLADNRCYWPKELLDEYAVRPEELLPLMREQSPRLEPVVARLRNIALEHVDAAFPYVIAIPAHQSRLRLSAIWPLWIALSTLEILRPRGLFAGGDVARIPRSAVYRIMAESTSVANVNTLLKRAHARRRAKVV